MNTEDTDDEARSAFIRVHPRSIFLLIALAALAACDGRQPGPIVTVVATPTIDPTPMIVRPTDTPAPTPTPVPKIRQVTSGGCCVQPFWSPDSRRVMFIDRPAPDALSGIYAVNVDEPLAEPFLAFNFVGLFSRDFRFAAYPEGRDTLVEQLDNGERWIIPNQGHEVVFSPDARRIAWEVEEIDGPFDQRRSDVYLARFDGQDAALVTTVYGGGLAGWLDDQRLLFVGRPSLAERDRRLTILGLNSNVAIDLVTAERIGGIAISPGGTWLAYFVSFNDAPARNGVWVQRTDGAPPFRLNVWGAYQWRDDTHLLYVPARESAETPFVIYEYNASTGQSRPVTEPVTAPIQMANGDWRVSPDGRWVVYVNSADRNLWLVELEP